MACSLAFGQTIQLQEQKMPLSTDVVSNRDAATGNGLVSKPARTGGNASLLADNHMKDGKNATNLAKFKGYAADKDYGYIPNDGVEFYCDFQDTDLAGNLFTNYTYTDLTPSSMMRELGYTKKISWIYTLRDSYESTNVFAGGNSQFASPATADAWLVTRAIQVPKTGYTLSWKSEALLTSKPDGLKVFISTTGGDSKDDFPTTPVWEVEEEEAGRTDNVDNEWVEHSIVLDAYAGQTIWVAFVNQSTDKGLICLDDVKVSHPLEFTLTTTTPNVVDQNTVKISGKIKAVGTTNLTSCTIHYAGADGVTHSEQISGLNLKPGEEHAFSFTDKLALTEKGKFSKYDVWAEIQGEKIGQLDSVLYATFVPTHKALLEEHTYPACGYCPGGILAIENLEKVYGENVVTVAVHSQGAFTNSDYISGLGLNAAPTGRVDRGNAIVGPFADLPGGGVSFEGEGTFFNAVQESLDRLTLVEPEVTVAEYDGTNINITVNTRFAFGGDYSHLCMAIAVTESDVESNYSQLNYYANSSAEIYGRFGKGGEMGKETIRNFTFQHVARGVFPNFSGYAELFDSEVPADDETAYNFTLPALAIDYRLLTNLNIIAILIDGNTGQVVNCDSKKVTINSGIEGIDAENQKLRIVGDNLLLPSKATDYAIVSAAGVRMMSGQASDTTVSLANLPQGMYVATATIDGKTQTLKFVK